MDRTYDLTLPTDTRWLADADAQAVCDAVQDGGHTIYFVGGCVRNALLGLPDSDVDMSTDALPERVMALAKRAGLKTVPTGVEHGTVTVVSGGKGFEVTTFRRDVQTDGRRAVVAFSNNIDDDARRRDFTINALYADAEGRVIDPLEGLPDLRARRVRFIEDAEARIREDYLRTLRYFRFHAWYADPAKGFDPDALSAIASNTAGLETLSAERIGAEMQKLLSAPDPAPALAGMRQTGVLNAILPGADDRWISMLVHFEALLGMRAHWIWRLAALGGDDAVTRLRLSKADGRMLEQIRDAAFEGNTLSEIAYRHGIMIAQGAMLLRACLAETPPDIAVLETIDAATQAKFPVAAKDLMPAYAGPALGARLAQLEAAWIASDFSATRDTLLDMPDT
ncbi:CCA tRNA nucleotidyltransferase [Roseobacter sp. GAI101]|uniref:CCA tRNA nucleotidyltransferase n=1 Tax=Roseobacter sp. (strain GAI101) TaxID=391589 RepID=UPI0001871D7C|nr:CCA tRNA nucleotidyltransferase [Roseobacter sp. GAI101]EEB85057.1 tRNA nucleotidyltransferase [Roseobacter sp. GAI101]